MKVTLTPKGPGCSSLKLSEAEVKAQVKEYLDARRIFHYPIAAGAFSKKGLPDRAIHYRGKVIYVECKATDGVLRPAQKEFHAQCEADGIDYWVIRDVEDLHARLEACD